MSLADFFMQSVEQTPNHYALIDENRRLTYKALYCHTLRLYKTIQDTVLLKENPVVVIIGDKSTETVVAILTVLLAGATYLPIDSDTTQNRFQQIIDIAQPDLALIGTVTSKSQQIIDTLPNDIFQCRVDLDNLPPKSIGTIVDSTKPLAKKIAYILFTSGSTGHPKGVCVSHQAAKAAVNMFIKHIQPAAKDKIISLAPLTFDLSIFDLFSSFAVGATVELIPNKISKNTPRLVEYLVNCQGSSLFTVPSLLHNLCLKLKDYSNKQLPFKRILVSGEIVTDNLLDVLRQTCPRNCMLWNLYGATETPYVLARQAPIHSSQNPRILNQVGDNIHLTFDSLHNDYEQELILSSPALFSGYLKNKRVWPSLNEGPKTQHHTNDLFKITPQGWELKGRKDRQYKINGKRIDLGDIEAAYETHALVDQAGVIYYSKQKTFVIFIALDQSLSGGSYEECRDRLTKHILNNYASHMIINPIIFISKMPQTTSGKKAYNTLNQMLESTETKFENLLCY